jgi:hypothetical protein
MLSVRAKADENAHADLGGSMRLDGSLHPTFAGPPPDHASVEARIRAALLGAAEAGLGGPSLRVIARAAVCHGGHCRVVNSTSGATSEFSVPGPSRQVLTFAALDTALDPDGGTLLAR